MRVQFLALILIVSASVSGQSLLFSTDSVYAEGSVQELIVRTPVLLFSNETDSTITVKIRQIQSNRDSFNWERTLFDHVITYPPNINEIQVSLDTGDTGRLVFEYYPNSRLACVEEEYEFTLNGSTETFNIEVTACSRSASSSLDIRYPGFELYPNPASDRLMIRTDHNWEHVVIYHLDGRVLKELQFEETLDVGFLQPGMYLFDMIDQTGFIMRKKLFKVM